MASTKFIFHKINKHNKEGYIYLLKIDNRIKKYQSLKLPKLLEIYWNEKKQRVRINSVIDHAQYNNKIEKILKKLNNDDSEIRPENKDLTESFLFFF